MTGITSLLSTTPNGLYGAGSVIDISVLFNSAVVVTGSPQLALALPSARLATYTGLTNADTTMHFSYTVQAGDTSADLDAISTSALTLNGGTITAAADLSAAVLTLPTPGTSGSLGANTSLVIDTTAPTVTSVHVPANATYVQGQALDFTVSLSEAVTVNTTGGTPYIDVLLDTGGTVHATYLSGSGTSTLTFRYTVAAGNADSNGITVGALNLAGATVTDQAGNPMTLTLNAVGPTAGVLVNGLNPVFSSAAVNGNNLVVSYNEATTLDAAHPPATTAYSVQVGGVADAVTGIVIDSAAKTATLTLATAVAAGQTVTLAYTDPTVGNDINALQNAAGNDASSFSATAITNNTVTVPGTGGGGGSGVNVSAPAEGGVLRGTPYADTFFGSGNKDIFYPAGGTDTVDGGAGLDTVVLTGNRSQYTLTHQSDGSFTVRSLVDGNSVVSLKNVERLTFDNQTLALDVTPASSRVAELYQLTLGRNPEEAGLGYHVAMNTQGATTAQLALDFVNSNEFSRLYSTLNSENLVTRLYLNAFGRAADADGLAFHLAQLAKNPGSVGLANVVADFVDSPEMAVKLAGMVDQGIALYG